MNRRKFEVVFVARGATPGLPSTTTSAPPPTPAPIAVPSSVTISSPSQTRDLSAGEITETWLTLKESDLTAGKEIEENIIDELVRMHAAWIERGSVEAAKSSIS